MQKLNDRLARPADLGFNIAGVERDTGLSKDTLRVWERRYGFPSPRRDEFGQRLYSADEIQRLRAIRRLTDAGLRPGKIIGLPLSRLEALAAERATRFPVQGPGAAAAADRPRYIGLIREHRVEVLRTALAQALARIGLAGFVTEIAAPLNRDVGDEWAGGRLELFEEHLYSEVMQSVLRHGIASLPVTDTAGPRVLLTTLPGEPHALGLLMAEAMIVLEGGSVVSLGTRTPVLDILSAAGRQQVDIVGLSFSPCLAARRVLDGLLELRANLPRSNEIWVGGSHPILRRRTPPGVQVFAELGEIAAGLARWRSRAQTNSVSTPV